MSKRTRYFMIGAVAFLILGLSIGTVAYYNGGFKGLRLAAAGPTELQFVPENAAIVAYANVQQIMKSDFRQRVKQLEAGKGERGQQEIKDQTGIDIESDIDTVVAYMVPEGKDLKPSGAVVASGRFDQPRITEFVKQKGGTVGDYQGKPILTFVSAEHPDGGGALAFLSANEVALGSADAVKRTVETAAGHAGGANVTTNAKLMDLIGRVDNGNAWVVGRFDALSSHAHLPDQVMSQIPPITWFSASTNINGGVSGKVSVEATDNAAAQNLLQVVEGLKGLAALQARSNNVPSQLQQILNSFQVSQDDKTLILSFAVPSDVLNGLMTLKGRGPSKK